MVAAFFFWWWWSTIFLGGGGGSRSWILIRSSDWWWDSISEKKLSPNHSGRSGMSYSLACNFRKEKKRRKYIACFLQFYIKIINFVQKHEPNHCFIGICKKAAFSNLFCHIGTAEQRAPTHVASVPVSLAPQTHVPESLSTGTCFFIFSSFFI